MIATRAMCYTIQVRHTVPYCILSVAFIQGSNTVGTITVRNINPLGALAYRNIRNKTVRPISVRNIKKGVTTFVRNTITVGTITVRNINLLGTLACRNIKKQYDQFQSEISKKE